MHIKDQLEAIVSGMGIPISESHSVPEYFCCLASGLRQYVCMKIDRFSYRSLTADRIMIHPGSAWFRVLPEYILAGEIVQTAKMYARTVSPLRKEWINRVDPELVASLRGRRRTKQNRILVSADESLNEMRKYRISKGKSEVYAVPLSEVRSIPVRSASVKFYIRCGQALSKCMFKASRIDKEISLIPIVQSPAKMKMKGKYSPDDKEFGEISSLIDSAFMPITSGKKCFSFLGITEKGGKFALAPFPSVGSAAKETLFSLSSMLDRIPKKQEKLRKKALTLQQRITAALDMDE